MSSTALAWRLIRQLWKADDHDERRQNPTAREDRIALTLE